MDNISLATKMRALTEHRKREKDQEREKKNQKMLSKIERYVKKHIYPKIERAANEGEDILTFSCPRKYSSYITIIQVLLEKEGFRADRSLFSVKTIFISWGKENIDD